MKAHATTRGRRFTRRTTEILCKLSRGEARLLRRNETIDVTEEQAHLLERNDLATIEWPKTEPKKEPKILPKQVYKKQKKTDSALSRTTNEERT